MVTGENATTWGNVTNTNLGQALEQAIVRQIDIVFADVNYTVPAVADNNGAQEARNLRLNLTGTATTPLNLIVPPFVGGKPYIVNNTTASTITVKNTTGTGIAVPAGKTMWVYNNGTNVVDAVTHLTSLTLATALPAASGGTGVNSPGTAGNVLTSNGTAWVSQASGGGGGGTVTSVNATTAISGLSFSGGPVTASGTLTLSGTLGAAGGGTGLVSAGTAGNVLTSNGTAWVSQAGGGSSGVSSFNTRTGAVTLTSSDVTTALGFTPVSSTGTGASGTWTISVTGSAALATTATTATTANATNTANTFQMSSLGVGTAGSGTAGEIRATNNVTAFYSSDARLKENVHPIQNALGIVSSVGGKTFDWTQEYIAEHGGEDGYFIRKSDFGVIAQDVQAVFPVAVRERGDGTLAVDYEKLVAVAFAAIAELRAEVEALKK